MSHSVHSRSVGGRGVKCHLAIMLQASLFGRQQCLAVNVIYLPRVCRDRQLGTDPAAVFTFSSTLPRSLFGGRAMMPARRLSLNLYLLPAIYATAV